jgi:hypothetical protein
MRILCRRARIKNANPIGSYCGENERILQRAKVFWFFFSKKNCFLHASCPFSVAQGSQLRADLHTGFLALRLNADIGPESCDCLADTGRPVSRFALGNVVDVPGCPDCPVTGRGEGDDPCVCSSLVPARCFPRGIDPVFSLRFDPGEFMVRGSNCGQAFGSLLSSFRRGSTGLEAEAVTAGFDDVAVVGQPIEHGRCHLGIAKDARPLAEAQIGRDGDT